MLEDSPASLSRGHCRLIIVSVFSSVLCLIRHDMNLKSGSKAADNMIQ
jgi:hypothetical protein